MSAEYGKMYASTANVTPESSGKMINATAADIKREPGSLLMSNGSSSLSAGEKPGIAALRAKLSSLKPARDLTLGGRGGALGATVNASSLAKKVYLPNLNVERRKNANVKTSKDTTARGGRGARGGGRGGRGGGRGGVALIQTQGVFSEGAGAVNIRKTSSTGDSYSRSSDDAASAMRKPTLVKNELKKIDIDADAKKVRDILGDSEDDYDELIDDKTDLEQIPIKLNKVKWRSIKTEIKSETPFTNGAVFSTDADDESALAVSQKMQAMAVQQHAKEHKQQQRALNAMPRYPQSVQELLRSTQQQIFIMQMPDTLPCEDDEAEGNDSPEKFTDKSSQIDPATSAGAAASTAAHCNSPISKSRTQQTHSLKKMEEGQVGKLVCYKSGKIKLVLGSTYFDLDMGMETGFVQDLMSITTNREERSGNMINLGSIQAKLTATPDWEQLLNQPQSQGPA